MTAKVTPLRPTPLAEDLLIEATTYALVNFLGAPPDRSGGKTPANILAMATWLRVTIKHAREHRHESCARRLLTVAHQYFGTTDI